VLSWTRQLKAANEEYAALNAKYLETDGAKQFLAEQQTAIAAAAECEVASSEAEDEGEEEQSATIKRKRRAPKQKKDPNGAVGALALAYRHSPRKRACGLANVCGLSKSLPHIDVDSEADSLSALQHPRSRCRPTSSSKSRIARRFAAPLACWRPALGLGDRWLATAGWTTAWPWGSAFFWLLTAG
jgi:hypothetical protein